MDAIVDWGALGEKIRALISSRSSARVSGTRSTRSSRFRVRGAAILECERLAGEWCVLVKVSVSDPNQITRLIDEMAKIPEVQGTNTTLVLSTFYETGNRQGASGEAEGRNA